jgi:DNA repair exonuclease SbcCD ATPase subunit
MQAVERQVLALQILRDEAVVKCDQKVEDLVLENREMLRRIDEMEAGVAFMKQEKSRVDTLLAETTNEYEGEIRKLTTELVALRASSKRSSAVFQASIAELEKAVKAARVESREANRKLDDARRMLARQQMKKQADEKTMKTHAAFIAELKRENSELELLKEQANEALFGDRGKTASFAQTIAEIRRLIR